MAINLSSVYKYINVLVQIGPKYSALALLNFNPKSREIVVSGYLFYPPGTQLYVDAQLNMTLPTLHPCTISTKVHEKQPNEFQVSTHFR